MTRGAFMTDAEQYWTKFNRWNTTYNVVVLLSVVNAVISFLFIFLEVQVPFSWVYGQNIWPAVGVQAVLAIPLTMAFKAAHQYHALATLADKHDQGATKGKPRR
jgi:hypothetical protein